MSDLEISVDQAFDSNPVEGTPIHWYINKLKESGITRSVASLCNLTLRVDDSGAHIRIPYFTIDAVETTFHRQRNRDAVMVREKGQSAGNFKGKYTQPPGSKSQVYWPPLYSQRIEFNDPSVPLLVCEGEFKAIAAKMAVKASGLRVLVAGAPGTSLPESVLQEFRNVNCIGPIDPRTKEQIRRVVYIAADWGGRGKSRENSAKLEFQLKELFQTLGARIVLLRWPVGDGDGGKEQKLDDWLVAGGDLSEAMDNSREEAEGVKTAISEKWDYFNKTYAILHGRYVPLLDPSQRYSPTDFNMMEAYNRVPVSPKKTLEPVEVWKLQPPEQQNRICGLTFCPAPLGVVPDRYVWEDGLRKLNTAPVPDVELPPWGGEVDRAKIVPFYNLLLRLCGGVEESAEWLLNFIAHAAQKPTERGHHIVIFKDSGGTGKSSLFATLDMVFGKYSGPIGSALSSGFNSVLEHLVLAHWSDPVIHNGSNRDLESAFKNYSGDSTLEINHKYGNKYSVKNYGRLFVSTNKDYIVPIERGERRYVVLGAKSPWPPEEWEAYDKWLKGGGVGAIREFLAGVDLSPFNINRPGPRTAQREQMERASRSDYHAIIEDRLDAKDIWKVEEIQAIAMADNVRMASKETVGKIITKIVTDGTPLTKKDIQRSIKVGGITQRMYVIRNIEHWTALDNAKWVEENAKSGEEKEKY